MKKIIVIIIEDDHDLLEILGEILSNKGFEVIT
jgi:DNA-binding response OmpR family regulator